MEELSALEETGVVAVSVEREEGHLTAAQGGLARDRAAREGHRQQRVAARQTDRGYTADDDALPEEPLRGRRRHPDACAVALDVTRLDREEEPEAPAASVDEEAVLQRGPPCTSGIAYGPVPAPQA